MLRKAFELKRIFVTRDKDFGALVFIKKILVGVILLRLQPSNISKVHKKLERLLKEYSEAELKSIFSIIEPSRIRTRKIS